MEEIWKDIPNYEGRYQVSNLGNVKSILKTREKLLKPCADSYGYLVVCLFTNCKSKQRFVHALVMEAFVGPRPNNMEVCHNDGNRQNNQLDNLRYDTHRNDIIDMVKQNRQHLQKLCESDVREIRKLLNESNLTVAQIARMYNVNPETVKGIKAHKLWKWLKEDE